MKKPLPSDSMHVWRKPKFS